MAESYLPAPDALVGMAADLPDQQELVTALIDNAEEIADLFGRYYPENTVNSLRDLLVRQVELTGGLITQKKKEERRIRWSRYAG